VTEDYIHYQIYVRLLLASVTSPPRLEADGEVINVGLAAGVFVVDSGYVGFEGCFGR
jgi:hypothetical protein